MLFTSSTDIKMLNFSAANILFGYSLAHNEHFKKIYIYIHFFLKVYMFYPLMPLDRVFFFPTIYIYIFFVCHSLLVRTVSELTGMNSVLR
ncbi:hypothetical protein Hanom_Chr04g00327751 [Helianthus anomalus]